MECGKRTSQNKISLLIHHFDQTFRPVIQRRKCVIFDFAEKMPYHKLMALFSPLVLPLELRESLNIRKNLFSSLDPRIFHRANYQEVDMKVLLVE